MADKRRGRTGGIVRRTSEASKELDLHGLKQIDQQVPWELDTAYETVDDFANAARKMAVILGRYKLTADTRRAIGLLKKVSSGYHQASKTMEQMEGNMQGALAILRGIRKTLD